jgi:hypothetical protein
MQGGWPRSGSERGEAQSLLDAERGNRFQQELERDVLIYKEQPRVLSERDAILRDAQHDIQSLNSKLHRCGIPAFNKPSSTRRSIPSPPFKTKWNALLSIVKRSSMKCFSPAGQRCALFVRLRTRTHLQGRGRRGKSVTGRPSSF